jgi:hypothetical protein
MLKIVVILWIQNEQALKEARDFVESANVAELEKWFCSDKLAFGTAGKYKIKGNLVFTHFRCPRQNGTRLFCSQSLDGCATISRIGQIFEGSETRQRAKYCDRV